MQLDSHQQHAMLAGEPVPLVIQGTECILVRKDIYEKARPMAEGDALHPDTIYELMESALAEDGANDPGLDLYQQYRQ